MIHYHGGPITPTAAAIKAWGGRHAFISYAHPSQIKLAGEICQSFALDNGAFSIWKANRPTDWNGYYEWVADWRRTPGFDFAVVPDVINGSESENDQLLSAWPFARHEGGAVWHTDESTDRLVRLANEWPLVCIGSSGEHDVAKAKQFVAHAKTVLREICDKDGYPICKLHGLRMLNPKIFTELPLASADSTNVAINIGYDSAWRGTYIPKGKELRAQILVERIESYNSATTLGPDCESMTAEERGWALL